MTTYGLPIVQVDAFTNRPFAGNPAAVCVLNAGAALDDGRMQAIALEMNLSETAFVERRPGAPFGLRWFTPAAEVRLCGHATLASAHALWEAGEAADLLEFDTLSGRLTARRLADGRIELDFPSQNASPAEPAPGLLDALGVDARDVRFTGRNGTDLLVVLVSEELVRALKPNLGALAEVDVRGVIVTARADNGTDADFVSRFFAPRVGVPEDPVTGSAHCCLAPYWVSELGRNPLTGYQASHRGGDVGVEVVGDRVKLRGAAVTVMRGELVLPLR